MKETMKLVIKMAILILLSPLASDIYCQTLPIDTTAGWEMTWNDEFDYEDSQLDVIWESQNGPSSHILCSRWRENAVVKNGILELQARKEDRGGQEWTAGNIWTKKWFKYGYFECKYKYAGATGTNNSFWFMTRGAAPSVGKKFEIDVNEGHFPNEINTNLHNWTDIEEDGSHPNNQLAYSLGVRHDYHIELDSAVKTKRLRFRSNNPTHFHIREFRAFKPNSKYPEVMSETADTDVSGLSNYVREAGTKISVSGVLRDEFNKERMADGNVMNTSWVSQKSGEKWVEIEFAGEREIGCIQFINGWKKGDTWMALITDYVIEYYNGSDWVELDHFDVQESYNLAEDYHVYGLLWTEDVLKYYYDGKLIRTIPNEFCFGAAPIWLSLAILEYAGEVTDAIDGTSMKIDYVRRYEKKDETALNEVSENATQVFPNPVHEKLFVKSNRAFDAISIYNTQGVLINKCNVTHGASVDVSDLMPGIYCYVASNDNETFSGRFIKQ